MPPRRGITVPAVDALDEDGWPTAAVLRCNQCGVPFVLRVHEKSGAFTYAADCRCGAGGELEKSDAGVVRRIRVLSRPD